VSPLDLSFRQKIPLWGSILVVFTALAVSATLMARTYAELEEDLAIDAETFCRALGPTLSTALLEDNVWRAYETISVPLRDKLSPTHTEKTADVVVVDRDLRIFVAADPRALRMQTSLRDAGPEFAQVADYLASRQGAESGAFHLPGSPHLFYATPISGEGMQLGTLIVVMAKASLMPRFLEIARYGGLAAALLLCVLLPLNWYWGRRMAEPLVQLTERMDNIGKRLPEKLDPSLYSHRDELGSLFKTYNKMLADLAAKEEMERQMVQSDRLAALGQLAAGVAHEINNPLGGMLMAIDTLKSHTVIDARIAKTIALLERGLGQIKDTVGALLVEARVKSRDLTASDIEDVLVLVLPQAHSKHLKIDWHNEVTDELSLPATLVRQVMINLLLNAVHAADPGGQIACHVRRTADEFLLTVTNDGKVLTPEQMTHLFEPFSPLTEGGHGLGLWVSYQVVSQLRGSIGAARGDAGMRFDVALPIEGCAT
jgi:two-component system, NtrC family, sensor kinase